MARIDIIEHGRCVLGFECPEGSFTAGREACSIELPDPYVSELHVSFSWKGTQLMATPQGFNGTLLNGTLMENGRSVAVSHGDELEIACFVLKIRQRRRKTRPARTLKRIQPSSLVGDSKAMRKLRGLVSRLAPRRTTVLLTGETGTGKGAVARAIYDAHPWGRFVPVNAAAIVGTLFESELFGHEPGAFTGARARKDGAFHCAHQGTLFLDEIGEIPLDLQPKLLRALEERQVKRLGATAPETLDVRVIAATNRDLEAMVRKGTFRRDLLSRLSTMVVPLPPLARRMEDLPELVSSLLLRIEGVTSVTPAALQALARCRWSDNVRGLRNTLERAAVYADRGVIDRQHLDGAVGATSDPDAIRAALAQTSSEREAADRLGMSRTTLRRRMKAFGIPPRGRGRPRKG